MYESALLIRCYTQHVLRPVINFEINHKIHFIKLPPIKIDIDFIDLPNIVQDKSVTSLIPDYFQILSRLYFVISIINKLET